MYNEVDSERHRRASNAQGERKNKQELHYLLVLKYVLAEEQDFSVPVNTREKIKTKKNHKKRLTF